MKNPTRISPPAAVLILTVIFLVFIKTDPLQADPATRYWMGGDWNSASSWNTKEDGSGSPGVPAAGDTAYAKISGSTLTYTNIFAPGLGILNLDGSDFLIDETILGGVNFSANWQFIGINAKSVFTQKSGTNNVGTSMYLGEQSTGDGTYDLQNGTLNVTGSLGIGNWGGVGLFKQSAGTVTTKNGLGVGCEPGSSGTYILNDGELNVAGSVENVGMHGAVGTFIQHGGLNTVSDGLVLGNDKDSTGDYVLTGGNLVTVFDHVGGAGSGIFSQTGGQHDVLGTLAVGQYAGSDGTYNFTGDSTLNSKDMIIGYYGSGMFDQNSPNHSVNIGTTLTLGAAAGGDGKYVLNDGVLYVGEVGVSGSQDGKEIIGDFGKGEFTQLGGENYICKASEDGALILGNNSTGNGTYTLNGGKLIATLETIALSGPGKFVQNGGINEVRDYGSGSLVVGAGSYGVYELFNGSLSAKEEIIADSGIGVFTQSGGDNTITDSLIIGNWIGSDGSYDLGDNSGTPVLNVKTEVVGWLGEGYVHQWGASEHNITDTLILGLENGSYGQYSLGGGKLSVGAKMAHSGEEIIGDAGHGFFIHDGGINNVIDDGAMPSYLILGNQAGSFGGYNMLDGQLYAYTQIIGKNGTGDFVQHTGKNDVYQGLTLGDAGSGKGTYKISDGELTLQYGNMVVGNQGEGTFTQDGGFVYLEQGKMTLGANASGIGRYTQNACSLKVTDNLVVGENGQGIFEQSGGLNTVDGSLIIGQESGSKGSFTLHDGLLHVKGYEEVGIYGDGTFTQYGGFNEIEDTLRTHAASSSGSGVYSLVGGTLTTNFINNRGEFKYHGGDLVVNNGFDNEGTFTLANGTKLTVNADVYNTGTVKTYNTSAEFTGTFTNNGEFNSDPSDNYFHNLIVNSSGYLTGGAGDKFYIYDNFTNNSTNSQWNTLDAYLGFISDPLLPAGSTFYHDYILGNAAAGFDWDTLFLGSANGLYLKGSFSKSLLFDNIILSDGLAQLAMIQTDKTIYYNFLGNANGTGFDKIDYQLSGGGWLKYSGFIPPANVVPEPGSIMLLCSGLLGLFLRKKFMS